MSHTNSTTNFGLPQFITTDKPAWLTDVNVAYAAIDTAMKNNQTAAASAQSDATQALSDASSAATTATEASTKSTGALSSIADTFSNTDTYEVGELVIYNNLLYRCTVAITVPGDWTGSANWIRETLENKIDGLSGSNLPYEAGSETSIKSKFDSVDSAIAGKADTGSVTRFVDIVVSGSNMSADGTISPFNYYGYGSVTSDDIHTVLGVCVYDTSFNNPAIACYFDQTGSTHRVIVYSARNNNVRVRLAYK